MNKLYFIIVLISSIFIGSCSKENQWDPALNGTWVEASASNSRALPSNCDIEFADGVMIICDESVGGDLNSESQLYANNGQIWISYRLGFRKHEEYRYDYEFDGKYLWIIEETSSKYASVINAPQSKKYYKK